MIDFDELDEADVNVRLRHVLDGDVAATAFAKVVAKLEDEDDPDRLGEDDPFGRAAEDQRPVIRPADLCEPLASATLAIVVPFREDASGCRMQQLSLFARHLRTKFAPVLPTKWRLVVLEQSASGDFNRGKLLNIGARWCKEFLTGDVIFCPHDVDMLPDPSLAPYYVHRRHGHCMHIGWVNRKYDYPTFFGGICSLDLEAFLSSGGFPNEFWGWGREDDVLHARLRVLADTRVVVPAVKSGITLQDAQEPHEAGAGDVGQRSRSANRVFRQHLLGSDNIFDPPSFAVVDYEERGCISHLLLDLHPSPAEEHAGPACAGRGASARVLAALVGDGAAGTAGPSAA